jgi:hypothetical protein
MVHDRTIAKPIQVRGAVDFVPKYLERIKARRRSPAAKTAGNNQIFNAST